VVLGASLQKHLGTGALIMGWGIAELAIMINTVAVYAYLNDCFPKHQVGPFWCTLNKRTLLRHFCRARSVLSLIWLAHLEVQSTLILHFAVTKCTKYIGFSVAYFQVPWAEKYGALQTFGCEAA